MNGVVRPVRDTDQVVGIPERFRAFSDLGLGQRVDVMHDYASVDVPERNTEVVPVVPGDDVVPEVPPFWSRVEFLVQTPLVPKGLVPNRGLDLQVLESLLESRQFHEFEITTTHVSRPRVGSS